MKRTLIVLALLAGIAHADDKKAAEKYFRLGAKAYAAQNFEAAATSFDEAYKNLPMPEIAFSAAQAYRRLYQIDPKPPYVKRAIELYEFYLANVKKGGRVGDAADNLLDMKRELAKLEAAGVSVSAQSVAPPRTRLGVNVSVTDQAAGDQTALREIGDTAGAGLEGVKATIDGKAVEPFALVEVDPKDHVIAVAADGYFPVEKKAQAIENQSVYVDVELKPKPAKLVLKTEGDARVVIDGRYVATTPFATVDVAAGKHLVSVLRNGREPFARELTFDRGQELTVKAPLVKTGRRRAVPWVLGASGLFLASAVTTGLFALSRDNAASDLRDGIAMGNRPPSDADMLDAKVRSRDHFVTATWVLGSAALVTAGVGGFLLFFDRPDADSGTVGVAGRF